MASPMRLLLIGDDHASRVTLCLAALTPYPNESQVLCRPELSMTQGVDFLEKKRAEILDFSPTDVVLHIGQTDLLPATLDDQLPMVEKFFVCLRRMRDWLETRLPGVVVWYSELLPLCLSQKPSLHIQVKRRKCSNKKGNQLRNHKYRGMCRFITHPSIRDLTAPLNVDKQHAFAEEILTMVLCHQNHLY